jgi:hypothetical protein
MAGVFISYRRLDSQDATGRIHDHLEFFFGREPFFRDIDRIHGGANFPTALSAALDSCAVVLAVIGPQWSTLANERGIRLQDPEDFVFTELKTALDRGLNIIPVLVSFARMPTPDELPPALRDLAYLQAVAIPPNREFTAGMRNLVELIHLLGGLPYEDYPSLLDDARQAGLVAIKHSFADDSTVYDEIAHCSDLLVVMNDGRSWIDTNQERLVLRTRDGSKKTRIVLLHPKSGFLRVLVKKNTKSLRQQVEEIRRSYNIVQALRAAGTSVDVRAHHGFNPYSLILSENYAFVSQYMFNERGGLPLLKFARSANAGLYHDIRSDAELLYEHADVLTADDFAR